LLVNIVLMITIRNENDYQYHLVSQVLQVNMKMKFNKKSEFIFLQ
jgi:hypothetical protein